MRLIRHRSGDRAGETPDVAFEDRSLGGPAARFGCVCGAGEGALPPRSGRARFPRLLLNPRPIRPGFPATGPIDQAGKLKNGSRQATPRRGMPRSASRTGKVCTPMPPRVCSDHRSLAGRLSGEPGKAARSRRLGLLGRLDHDSPASAHAEPRGQWLRLPHATVPRIPTGRSRGETAVPAVRGRSGPRKRGRRCRTGAPVRTRFDAWQRGAGARETSQDPPRG